MCCFWISNLLYRMPVSVLYRPLFVILSAFDSNWTEGLVHSFKVTDAISVRFRWTDLILSCGRNSGPVHHRD